MESKETARTPQKTSIIADVLRAQQEALGKLDEATDQVLDKTASVLRSEPLAEGENTNKSQEYNVPLAVEIDANNDRINIIARKLERLCSLCEL